MIEKEVTYKILSKGGLTKNMVKYKQDETVELKPSLAERLNREDKNLNLQLVEAPVKEKIKP